MSGKAIMVVVAGLIVIATLIFFNVKASSTRITANFNEYYLRQTGQNIAQTGLNLALRKLANDKHWRSGFPLTTMMGGELKVDLMDSTYLSRKVVKIISVGIVQYPKGILEYGGKPQRIDTAIALVPSGFFPITVKGVITTSNPVRTLGNLNVDGRDHTPAGALLGGATGTLGVWTTSTLDQGGSSTIGGTAAGIDHAPAHPADLAVVSQLQTWPGGYPGTPDSLLGGITGGFPEGTLKAIAQSGANGSQYATNPSTLTYPLTGVTYVELPSGGTWQSMDISGSGILIVHNAAKNAIMKNLNSGTFSGIIIGDDILHVHATIIGCIISISPSPSSGNTVGDGNGNVLFSQESVVNATETTTMIGNGSSSSVLTWWE